MNLSLLLGRISAATLAADRRDAAIMAELSQPGLGRATLCPITLAGIGLDGQDFKALIRDCLDAELAATKAATKAAIDVREGGEHITLAGRFAHVQRSGSGLPGSIEEC